MHVSVALVAVSTLNVFMGATSPTKVLITSTAVHVVASTVFGDGGTTVRARFGTSSYLSGGPFLGTSSLCGFHPFVVGRTGLVRSVDTIAVLTTEPMSTFTVDDSSRRNITVCVVALIAEKLRLILVDCQ